MEWDTKSAHDCRYSFAGFSIHAVARRYTILVVEDDPELLPLKREVLQSEGYAVHGFATAGEALQFYWRHDSIDLLIADVRLPLQKSGTDLAERLVAIKPTLPVLLMSGSPLDLDEFWKVRSRGWIFVRTA